jgi:O-antigen/teichoic acid export membrane protein
MNQKLVKNSLLLSVGRFFARYLGLFNTIIVARLLAPEDYGVIVIAMLIQDFALRLQNIGFAQNVISAKQISPSFLSAIFLSRLGTCFFISLSVYLIAPVFCHWMNSPQAADVLRIICWIITLNAMCNLNLIIQAKNNNFIPEIKTVVSAKLISVAVTIGLAYFIGNYWALAIGMLSAALASFILSYYFAAPSLYMKTTFPDIVGVLSFSRWFLFQQLVEYFNQKLPDFTLGQYFSGKILGYFSMASSVASMYSQEVSAAFDKANLSHLSIQISQQSSVAQSTHLIQKNIEYLIRLKNILIIPVYVGLICYSEEVILILLGESWLDIVDVFRVLCLAAIFSSYRLSFRVLFSAIRYPRFHFYSAVVSLLVYIPMMYLTIAQNNYVIMGYGLLCSHFAVVLFSIWMIHRRCKINVLPFMSSSIALLIFFGCLAELTTFLPVPGYASMLLYGLLAIASVFAKNAIKQDEVIVDIIDTIKPKLLSIYERGKTALS